MLALLYILVEDYDDNDTIRADHCMFTMCLVRITTRSNLGSDWT